MVSIIRSAERRESRTCGEGFNGRGRTREGLRIALSFVSQRTDTCPVEIRGIDGHFNHVTRAYAIEQGSLASLHKGHRRFAVGQRCPVGRGRKTLHNRASGVDEL